MQQIQIMELLGITLIRTI